MRVNCLTHIGWQSAALPPTASSCPMGTTKYAERLKEYRRGGFCLLSGIFVFFCLHDLRHEATHGLCCLVLLLPCGVGVGAEGEARVVVTQHRGYCFDIHAVLECQGRERVSQVVKPDMLQPCVLEDPLVECYHRVGVIHFSCSAGWEHPRIVGVFGVFLLQQLHGILRDGHLADGVAGFGAA